MEYKNFFLFVFIFLINAKILASSEDYGYISLNVSGKLTDSFQIIENKLIKEYPELKNKKLFYLVNGQNIYDKHDKHKTLAQLKIKNSDTIIFNEHPNE